MHTEKTIQFFTTQSIEPDKQTEVLEKLKKLYTEIHINSKKSNERLYYKKLLKNLLNSKTLLEWLQECERLYREDSYFICIVCIIVGILLNSIIKEFSKKSR